MRTLIFIKHASPLVIPGTPPEKWKLSDRGIESCAPLAERLRAHDPAVIVTSIEPKAIQTGQIVGEQLGIPVEQAAGLQEHDRSNVPHMRSGEFISHMELFFRRPGERVLGRESADEALARFSSAMESVLSSRPSGNLAVVSHGTVLALFLARHIGQGAFDLWRRMGLPSLAVMEMPEYQFVELVDRV